MKRVSWVVGGLALLALSLIVVFVFSKKPYPASFKVDEAASFYVIYDDKLSSYQLQDGQVALLDSQNLPKMAYQSVQNYEAVFDQQALVFGSRSAKDFVGSLYRLDFQSGQVTAVKTKGVSEQIGGQTQASYLSYTGDQLHAFDQGLRLVKSLDLPGISPVLTIPAKDGQIYLTAAKVPAGDGGLTYSLYQIDEATMRVTKATVLGSENLLEEQYFDSAILGDSLYLAIVGKRDPSTYQYQSSYELRRVNLTTGQEDLVGLNWPAPMYFHDTGSQRFLVIEHSSYELGRLLVTILDGHTGQQQVVDVTDWIQVPVGEARFSSLKLVQDRYLLGLVANQLLVYDLEMKRLSSQAELSDDVIAGLFVVP